MGSKEPRERHMNSKRTVFSVLWRSFFLQAVWNFERLQNVGFVYGLLPFFRLLYPDPEKRKEVVLRHIGFFNTHPYMAPIIFGFVAFLEEEIKEGRSVTPEAVLALKNNIAGPLAAIGDTFFWATWRPFTALLSISIILFLTRLRGFEAYWLLPVIFLAVYNAVHIPFRYWGIKISYRLRDRIVDIVADLEFQYAVDMVRFAGMILLGSVLMFYFWSFAGFFYERLTFFAVFACALAMGYFRWPPMAIFYGIIGYGVISAFIKG